MVEKTLYQPHMDRLAIITSGLCIIHCILTPVLLALLPTAVFIAEFHDTIELLLLAGLLPISLIAIFKGYHHHSNLLPTYNAVGGVILILLAQLVFVSEAGEIIASVAGGLSLVIAHIVNITESRRCIFSSTCED